MADRRIEILPPDSLRPWAKNARTHSKKQIRQLADSIRRFGFTNPVLIDEGSAIIAGHGRIEAAKLIGWSEVPCLRVLGLSEIEKRAYVIADNKLALNAGWDEQMLAEELKGLLAEDVAFDVGLTGFSIAEVDSLVEGLSVEEAGDPRDDALPHEVPARCRPGDLYALGPHRLLCGDALDERALALLMDGEQADMVFTDPPYNVPIDGNVSGLGKTKHREFAMASGEMTPSEFTAFLRQSFIGMAAQCRDGAICFVCMDWRHMQEMHAAGAGVFSELKNLIVWAKDNGGMGTFYRSRHELIFAWKVGEAAHHNSFELGQHGRHRTNVWQYRGVNTLRAGRLQELQQHPTAKPVALLADAIKDVSPRGGLVLDPFGGSGSTLIAAQKTGRRARLIEIDPIYCDRIIQRWETYAKDEAELVGCDWPRVSAGADAAGSPPPRLAAE
jgi:DNA modification methylase